MVNRRLRSAARTIKPDGSVFHRIASLLKAVPGKMPGTVYLFCRRKAEPAEGERWRQKVNCPQSLPSLRAREFRDAVADQHALVAAAGKAARLLIGYFAGGLV